MWFSAGDESVKFVLAQLDAASLTRIPSTNPTSKWLSMSG
jgi:hypothetical protein